MELVDIGSFGSAINEPAAPAIYSCTLRDCHRPNSQLRPTIETARSGCQTMKHDPISLAYRLWFSPECCTPYALHRLEMLRLAAGGKAQAGQKNFIEVSFTANPAAERQVRRRLKWRSFITRLAR